MRCPICNTSVPPSPLSAFDEHWANHIHVLPPDDGRAVHQAMRARSNNDPVEYRKACQELDREARRHAVERAICEAMYQRLVAEGELSPLYWDGEEWHNLDFEDLSDLETSLAGT